MAVWGELIFLNEQRNVLLNPTAIIDLLTPGSGSIRSESQVSVVPFILHAPTRRPIGPHVCRAALEEAFELKPVALGCTQRKYV